MATKHFNFKQLGGFLSASAVVLSLVFVGLEVQETTEQTKLNTEVVQMAAYQDLIAQIAQINVVLLELDLTTLYRRMSNPNLSRSDLSPLEITEARHIFFLLAISLAKFEGFSLSLKLDQLSHCCNICCKKFGPSLYIRVNETIISIRGKSHVDVSSVQVTPPGLLYTTEMQY